MALSIIIPTHDRPDEVRRAVASAISALPDGAEIVVVNDNSGDAGLDLQSPHPAVRIVEGSGAGPAAARNAGVDAARHPVLLFLDDDDELLPDYPARVLAAASEGARTGYSACEDPEARLRRAKRRQSTGFVPQNAPFRDRIFGAGMGFWIEKDLFHSVGGFIPGQAIDEDTDLCCRLAAAGIDIWYEEKPGVRLHAGTVQLTASVPPADRRAAYRDTLERNVSCFPARHPARWFLLTRYVRRAVKDGHRREALSVVLSQTPVWIIPPALAFWATKSLFSRS